MQKLRKIKTLKSGPVVKFTKRMKKRNRKKLRAAVAAVMCWYNSLAVQFRRHHPTGGRKIRLS